MVAGVEQQRADQEEGLLRAGHDEHLVGIAPDAAGGVQVGCDRLAQTLRSDEHTSELQSLMRISNAVFCSKNKKAGQMSKDHDSEDMSHVIIDAAHLTKND